jgi:tRNA threonylcarbamoyladenosine dehydratase
MPSSVSDIPPQLARTADLYGADGVERLRRAFVVVVGLGGVGSHAAVALARSGVGRVRLVDHDVVTVSSLNRHAAATATDVGEPKTEVVARLLAAVQPGIAVEPLRLFCTEDTFEQVLGGSPDWVVDAIDGVNTKVSLLETCVRRGLHVVSGMGASCRTDPTRLRVDDISRTEVCPLAARIRRRLRRRGVDSGVLTVFSTEPPLPSLPPDEVDPQLGPGRTRRRLPSSSTLPGIVGYALAGLVIERIARG